MRDFIKSNVYLSSISLFSEFNDECVKSFYKSFPASATAGVKLMPGTLVEISVVVYKDQKYHATR